MSAGASEGWYLGLMHGGGDGRGDGDDDDGEVGDDGDDGAFRDGLRRDASGRKSLEVVGVGDGALLL